MACLLALALAAAAGGDSAGSGPGTPSGLPQYTILDLDTFGPARWPGTPSQFTPHAINASGTVAGITCNWLNADDDLGDYAAVCDRTGMHDLGALDTGQTAPNTSDALGLNDLGQVVGYSQLKNASHAFLWQYGVMHDLGAVNGHDWTAAAINNAGQIVGTADGGPNVLWKDGTTTDLGSLLPAAINDAGQVAGSVPTGDGSRHAAIWQNGAVKDLGALDGDAYSVATGINATGQVVGMSAPGPQQHGHAFFYDGSALHDLGTLGGSYSSAEGINAAGQIVGWAYTAADTYGTVHAFLYSGGAMIDLNDLLPASSGWVLSEARAINDAGQIVGVGTWDGVWRPFLLTFPDDPRVALQPNDLTGSTAGLLLTFPGDPPVAPPAAPSGLSVTTASLSEQHLTWTSNSDNATAFEVQSTTSDDGTEWRDAGTVPGNTTTFASTGLQISPNSYNSYYTYRVRAVNALGVSAWSDAATDTTLFRPHAAIGYGPGLTFVYYSHGSGFDFGTLRVGAPGSPQTVTVSNDGSAPLDIKSITVTGANASDFTIASPVATPQTLAPGGQLTLSLVFTPGGHGPRTATLTLADNEPAGAASEKLSGTGIGPVVQVSAGTLDFGPQPVGLSSNFPLLLRNTGDAALTVSGLAIQGPDAGDFSLPPGGWTGGTLQPGDITLLTVRFNPSATGSRTASLVIAGDDPAGPTTVSLTGFGTAPLLQLSADSLIFGLQAGSTQTLTLTNTGDAPLTITGLGLTGPDVGHFRIVSDTGEQSLPVGASRTVQIAFQPVSVANAPPHAQIAAVSYYATLEVRDNDPHPTSPHTVALIASSSDTGPAGDSTPPPPPPSAGSPTSPAPPTGLSVQPAAGEIDLTWTDGAGDETAVAIFRQAGSGPWQRIAEVPPTATRYADRDVQPGMSYTYRVRTHDNRQVSAWSNAVSPAPLLPAPLIGLTATAISPGEIDLTWTHGTGDETAIAVFRQASGGPWQRIAEVNPTAGGYADQNAQPGVSYRYRVRTHDNVQVSAWSNEVPAGIPLATPAPPASLSATVVSPTEIDLSWTGGLGSETAVAIFRRAGSGPWQRIAEVPPGATTYADQHVQAGVSYSYRVRTHDNHQVSAWSNEVEGVTPAGP